jgi:hypothetical protein
VELDEIPILMLITSLSQKYFFSLNAAMDGSSRFGQEVENGVALDGVHFAVLPSASFCLVDVIGKFHG